jgi:hypothetical protein
MILPIYYTKKYLNQILEKNKIDLNTNIKECKKYMALNGWTLSKNIKVDKDSLILTCNIIKKIIGFKGQEIHIQKRGEIIAALMENERDALLVCIIEAIRRKI